MMRSSCAVCSDGLYGKLSVKQLKDCFKSYIVNIKHLPCRHISENSSNIEQLLLEQSGEMESPHMPKRERASILPRIGIIFCVSISLCLILAIRPKAATANIRFSMRVGQTVRLQLKDVDESLIWRIASGTKRVKLKQNGLLTAKRSGRAVIKVAYNGVTYRFRVTIRPKKRSQSVAVRDIMLRVPLAGITGTPSLGPEVYTAPPRADLATTSGKKVTEDNVIMIGDSRFEGMHKQVGGSATWICSVGEGIYWLRDSVIPQLDSMDVKKKAVVINLGINDLTETNEYLSVLKTLGKRLRKRGATVYFMTVNPVDEAVEPSYGYSVQNQTVVDFNRTIANALNGFGIIDTYDYLVDHAFTTTDGVHYPGEVYQMIYSVMRAAVCKS